MRTGDNNFEPLRRETDGIKVLHTTTQTNEDFIKELEEKGTEVVKVESKPAGKAKGTRPVEQFKKKKKLTKKEKKDFYKVFTELIQEHSDEVGYWEPTAYFRGMWKAEEILKKLLEEW